MLTDDALPRLPRTTLPGEDLDRWADREADEAVASGPGSARPADGVRAALAAARGEAPAKPPVATRPRPTTSPSTELEL